MERPLFIYGTLGLEHVQQALFGRKVPMRPAQLLGYALTTIEIENELVVSLSGKSTHRILVPDVAASPIEGHLLDLTEAELKAADDYEVPDYRRTEAKTSDGESVWAYVAV